MILDHHTQTVLLLKLLWVGWKMILSFSSVSKSWRYLHKGHLMRYILCFLLESFPSQYLCIHKVSLAETKILILISSFILQRKIQLVPIMLFMGLEFIKSSSRFSSSAVKFVSKLITFLITSTGIGLDGFMIFKSSLGLDCIHGLENFSLMWYCVMEA